MPKKKALIFSMFIYSGMLAVTLFAFSQHAYPQFVSRILLNFFISLCVFILAFYFLQEIFKIYLINQELEKAAGTDHLTNLPNRRKIDEILKQQIQQSDSAISIIMFDIDHFKSINDNYGHDVGDSVLKQLASLITRDKNENEFLGRWGGEEFIIVVSGKINALNEAERMRMLIESHNFEEAGSITASFGVATLQPEDGIESVINRADAALYLSKQRGRNQVHVL
ncbi:GGDEF domain-containing protein [Bacillus sp. T33-2]|uniref:GGDEF domain-containing protein n=1 Tax=Bacillus sp. T33-2 TaxID=2054168 RepID=UPI0015E10BC9|nr:GGDEF domain-containing protein [Bacillus sp. T33-2]